MIHNTVVLLSDFIFSVFCLFSCFTGIVLSFKFSAETYINTNRPRSFFLITKKKSFLKSLTKRHYYHLILMNGYTGGSDGFS